jgi:hypothetical protein
MNDRVLAQLLPPSTERIRIAFYRPTQVCLALERRILVTCDRKFKTTDWIARRNVSKYSLRVDFSDIPPKIQRICRGRESVHFTSLPEALCAQMEHTPTGFDGFIEKTKEWLWNPQSVVTIPISAFGRSSDEFLIRQYRNKSQIDIEVISDEHG